MRELHYYVPPKKNLRMDLTCELCIYGGTSGGIAAATVAKRLGLRVIVLAPSAHVGGLSAGGLGATDVGNKHAIGGIAREFYRRLGSHSGKEECWCFEPHVAESVFLDWIREENIPVHYGSFLHRVELKNRRIVRLSTENGITVSARVFLDCSYEGDLMAAAGVTFAVGRESNDVYGETLNGAQVRPEHQFDLPVDPYVEEGQAASGLVPGVESELPETGRGDQRIQAYNFRLCLTQNPAMQTAIRRPDDYRREDYELLARYCRAGHVPDFTKFERLENGKVDLNNHGAVSTDLIGGNHSFPLGSYADREAIFQRHVSYTKGLLWFWKQDEVVDRSFQSPFQEWGWAADEFQEYGGFSHALYVREARRLVGDVVMTEHHCTGAETVEDSVAMAAYTMDSHNCRRFVDESGHVRNEGDVQVPCGPPYPISFRAIVPRRGECENLLVPFCLSASHIAFGSIRLEPVFMALSESCVHAALLALSREEAIQEIPYEELRANLLHAGQKL